MAMVLSHSLINEKASLSHNSAIIMWFDKSTSLLVYCMPSSGWFPCLTVVNCITKSKTERTG